MGWDGMGHCYVSLCQYYSHAYSSCVMPYRHDWHLPTVTLCDNIMLQQLPGDLVHRLLSINTVPINLPIVRTQEAVDHLVNHNQSPDKTNQSPDKVIFSVKWTIKILVSPS